MRFLLFRRSNNITPAPDLTGRLEALLEAIGKLGREQFRANTLLEGYGATLDDLSEAWREYVASNNRDPAQRALDELEDQVRLRLAKDLLSVADALHASIVAARDVRATPPVRPAGRSSLLQRLLTAPAPSTPNPNAAVESWLEGVLLAERRLLALFEREGIQPIPALGRPFDPRQHLAVAVRNEPGVADGTIVAEELRGYNFGERVLRHAEVVVARTQPHIQEHERATHGDDRRH
jgi:molecular chaperone GrpE (heat shock protein)